MDITQITPNLCVGSNPTRSDALAIARRGITHVVDVRGEPSANGAPEVAEPQIWAGTGVRYNYVPMRDNGTTIPVAKYAEAVGDIAAAIIAGGTVLVHCSAGHYRSPSVAYAYLRKTGLSPDEAWSLVSRRPGASRQYIDSATRYLASIGISGGGLVTGIAPGSTATTGKTPSTGPLDTAPPKSAGSNTGMWVALAALALGIVVLAKRSEVRHNPMGGELEAGHATYRGKLHQGRIVDIFRVYKTEDRYHVEEFVWYMPPGTTKLPTKAGSDYRAEETKLNLPDYLAAERLFNNLRGS